MLAKRVRIECACVGYRRRGAAAVEFAVCLPLLVTLLLGLWEVGRMVEVQQVVYNSCREGARDASMGQANLQAVASNLILYLQGAEPTAFGQGDATSLISPVIALPANTFGYTCWDNTANRELFTVTFTDLTNPNVTDPTGMFQLDVYIISVSYPIAGMCWYPVNQLTGNSRMTATLNWACMVDSPYQLGSNLAAQ
jgi:Flp pilus assembly protein TadG